MSDKPKFPRAIALDVAREILAVLTPHCTRVIVAGSLRRRRDEVGDVEILYVPKVGDIADPSSLFGERIAVNYAESSIAKDLLATGILETRPNVLGSDVWGAKNKLACHCASGVPVDLFAATEQNWWNYVVCRTGGATSNVAVCNAAIRKGWKWNPYGEGFSRASGLGREAYPIHSEREVFEFVGLEYLEPWARL